VKHGFSGDGLRRIEDAFGSLARFSLINGAEDVSGGDGPIAGSGDDAAVVEDGAGRILPLVNAGVEIGLQDFNGVVAGIGPEELQGADHTEFTEAGKIFRLDELFMSKR